MADIVDVLTELIKERGINDSLRAEIASLKAENADLQAKVTKYERIIGLSRIGIPVAWTPKLMAQEDEDKAKRHDV